MSAELLIRQWPMMPYAEALARMQAWVAAARADQADEVWFVQHPPVYTLGQAGNRQHLIAATSIPVIQSDRGGQITYHGPGQLVVYFLLHLKRYGLGARALVHRVEALLMRLLRYYGIQAEADKNRPGLYVSGAKIASLGFRIRRGLSYHGIALNVGMDLAPFGAINPCGYPALSMTQMVDCTPHRLVFDEVQAMAIELVKGFASECSGEPLTDRSE